MSRKYGLKEVADVCFYDPSKIKTVTAVGYELQVQDDQPQSIEPVIKFDSLKTSSIEFTSENTEAKGGWGNASLVMWDYGKEMTLTLEDALISPKSLGIMMGAAPTEAKDNGQQVIGQGISVNAFDYPGTYAVTGMTKMRDIDGVDHPFYFYIPKAKLSFENTFTMEAEGDPTVFSMKLRVLRSQIEDTGKFEMIRFYMIKDEINTTVEELNTAHSNFGKV